jgi:hypothetical protein
LSPNRLWGRAIWSSLTPRWGPFRRTDQSRGKGVWWERRLPLVCPVGPQSIVSPVAEAQSMLGNSGPLIDSMSGQDASGAAVKCRSLRMQFCQMLLEPIKLEPDN